tara:strand:- start:11 stop:364 length:354 start_codon:yes stop_codon:yes gene_type:complete
VKRISADGSVAFAHARVGHRQAPNTENPSTAMCLGFFIGRNKLPQPTFAPSTWHIVPKRNGSLSFRRFYDAAHTPVRSSGLTSVQEVNKTITFRDAHDLNLMCSITEQQTAAGEMSS